MVAEIFRASWPGNFRSIEEFLITYSMEEI
jgi:hypothetical protein